MLKLVLVFLVIAAACVDGNPATGVREWHGKPRRPTVSPNVMSLPFEKLIDSYTPTVRIPGTKTVEGCGPVKPEDRVTGGTFATNYAYPWQVLLYMDKKWFCGGHIISEDWILTAAHCIEDAEIVIVLAGARDILQYEITQVEFVTGHYFMHEHYGPYFRRNDIALVHVPTPLVWSDHIAPICLPTRSSAALATGTLVTVAGYGMDHEEGDIISTVVQEALVPVMDTDECRAFYKYTVPDKIICTDTAGGHGICSGDSGSPLQYAEGGVIYTRGVASFWSANGCQAGEPDGYTRIIDYLDWIETNTGIIIGD